jgi:hypothetical protein
MKLLKINLVLSVAILIISCSSDDEDTDYSGIWNLSSITVVNSLQNNPTLDDSFTDYNFNYPVEINENCFAQSRLIILPNNTATLEMTSTLQTMIQEVEGSENELEQIVTCTNESTITNYTWILNAQNKAITFYDTNSSSSFSGIISPDNRIAVIGYDSNIMNSIFVDLQGEELEYSNSNFTFFER